MMFYYYYCRLHNSNLYIQQNTHVDSFKTFLLSSLSSSLLFVTHYCRKIPGFQALLYTNACKHHFPRSVSPCSPSSQLLLHPITDSSSKFMSSSLIWPVWDLLPGADLHIVLIETRFCSAVHNQPLVLRRNIWVRIMRHKKENQECQTDKWSSKCSLCFQRLQLQMYILRRSHVIISDQTPSWGESRYVTYLVYSQR